MLILKTPQELQSWRKIVGSNSIGFVPTMGALHDGHKNLLEKSVSENEITVLSIFVNPTQFNDKTDFEKYPNTLAADIALAESVGVQILFAPQFSEMYPDDYKYKISENDFSLLLCGANRPGHFDGVLSVVMKLFNLVQPNRAYFGEKDFQQLTLIQGMVKAFFLPLEIVPVSTVREKDGLAMSSRNVRLTSEERSAAPVIFETLKSATTSSEAVEKLSQQGWQVDYVQDINHRRYAAVKVGSVRLIDNVQI